MNTNKVRQVKEYNLSKLIVRFWQNCFFCSLFIHLRYTSIKLYIYLERFKSYYDFTFLCRITPVKGSILGGGVKREKERCELFTIIENFRLCLLQPPLPRPLRFIKKEIKNSRIRKQRMAEFGSSSLLKL